MINFLGRLSATGTTGVLDGSDSGGKSPFTEGRTIEVEVRPDASWTGSNETFQGSQDGGTTWTNLFTSTEIGMISAGQPFSKNITMPNRLRGSATRTAGTIAFYARGNT